ncbi:MAG TPA: hypothetical protein VGT24_06335 [Candidatus Acidoferrales bacterium]|nr:hypothetical protein [Candidatus Acidoferrales bacterium]
MSDLFVPPFDFPAGTREESPADPEFRWNGQRTTGEKTPEAAARARQAQFKTIEEFAAWRRSKGMPDLSRENLYWAWLRYRGEAPGEHAVQNLQDVERR